MTETHVLHAHVLTMQRGAPPAESLAWSEGRIVAVGTRAEVRAQVPAGSRQWELGDQTVLPGFIDAHHHAAVSALYGGRLRLVPPRVTDIASLQTEFAAAAARTPPGRWLVATSWNEFLLRERRAPTRAELDEAVPDHPLLAMHYSCHRAVANSRALELAGIQRHTAEPSGGRIERGRGGEPSGGLIERGMSEVERLARADLIAHDAEEILLRMGEHERGLLASGITRLADAAVPLDLVSLYDAAHSRGLARIPTVLMPVSIRGWLEPPTDVLEQELPRLRAATLSLGPVKMIFDGAHACAMCLHVWQSAVVFFRTAGLSIREGTMDPLRSAFSLAPRLDHGRVRTGILIYGREQASACVRQALERGHATAVHAVGNEAVDVALGAYAAAGQGLHAHGQARIEHGIFLGPEHVERMAGLGLALVVQPPFLALPEFAHTPSIPRIAIMPFRRLLDAGVALVGSSDFPVVHFDPIAGIRAATHQPHLDPEQQLRLEEALALYTRTAAEVLGVQGQCGTLEVGKRADLVLFDQKLDERTVGQASVVATVLGGKVAHGALG